MKKIIIFLTGIILVSSLVSCGEEALRAPETVITEKGDPALNVWIRDNFTYPYNIQVNYTWDNSGSDQGVDLVPPDVRAIKPFLKVILKVWATPYITTATNKEVFLKESTLRELNLYGQRHSSAGALAKNGYAIIMYQVDDFLPYAQGGTITDKSALTYYIQTIHHEYIHILNQMRKFPDGFKKISGTDYKSDYRAYTLQQALDWGFISQYSMLNSMEDFAELTSYYLTDTPQEWNTLVARASTSGQDRISQKVQIMTEYMKGYGIDINVMRDRVLAAMAEVTAGNIEIK